MLLTYGSRVACRTRSERWWREAHIHIFLLVCVNGVCADDVDEWRWEFVWWVSGWRTRGGWGCAYGLLDRLFGWAFWMAVVALYVEIIGLVAVDGKLGAVCSVGVGFYRHGLGVREGLADGYYGLRTLPGSFAIFMMSRLSAYLLLSCSKMIFGMQSVWTHGGMSVEHSGRLSRSEGS